MDLMSKTDTARAIPVAETLSYSTADCALGKVLAARSGKGICAILLGDTDKDLMADLAARFPQARLTEDGAALQADMAKVLRYIATPSEGLSLTLDMRGTPFQRRVWERLVTIPAGRTVSYQELARQIGPSAHPRAIAGACAANPIALAVPCHRVLRSNGELAGYRWGIGRKRTLLDKEAAV